MAERQRRVTRKHREDVDGQTVRLLHDDELDAVSGGKAGGDKQKYMIVTMSECLISSF